MQLDCTRGLEDNKLLTSTLHFDIMSSVYAHQDLNGQPMSRTDQLSMAGPAGELFFYLPVGAHKHPRHEPVATPMVQSLIS